MLCALLVSFSSFEVRRSVRWLVPKKVLLCVTSQFLPWPEVAGKCCSMHQNLVHSAEQNVPKIFMGPNIARRRQQTFERQLYFKCGKASKSKSFSINCQLTSKETMSLQMSSMKWPILYILIHHKLSCSALCQDGLISALRLLMVLPQDRKYGTMASKSLDWTCEGSGKCSALLHSNEKDRKKQP